MGKIGNSDYDFEFEEPLNLLLFCGWLAQNAKGFANNIVGKYGRKPKPLYEWLEWFLDWTEYTDYKTRKNRIIPLEMEEKYISDCKKAFGDDYFERMYPNG